LESVCRGNSTVGSNPTLSATCNQLRSFANTRGGSQPFAVSAETAGAEGAASSFLAAIPVQARRAVVVEMALKGVWRDMSRDITVQIDGIADGDSDRE
jgi:hypothetical protein